MKTQTQNFANLNSSKVVNKILKNVIGLSIVVFFGSSLFKIVSTIFFAILPPKNIEVETAVKKSPSFPIALYFV